MSQCQYNKAEEFIKTLEREIMSGCCNKISTMIRRQRLKIKEIIKSKLT